VTQSACFVMCYCAFVACFTVFVFFIVFRIFLLLVLSYLLLVLGLLSQRDKSVAVNNNNDNNNKCPRGMGELGHLNGVESSLVLTNPWVI
jgi:hypothetical protein